MVIWFFYVFCMFFAVLALILAKRLRFSLSMISLMMMMESIRHTKFCYFFVETNINFSQMMWSNYPKDNYQVNLHDFIPFCTKYIQISLIFYTILPTFSFFPLLFFCYILFNFTLICIHNTYIGIFYIYIQYASTKRIY